jgi:hypothetical protein
MKYITKFLRTPFRPDVKALNYIKSEFGRPNSAENFVMYFN